MKTSTAFRIHNLERAGIAIIKFLAVFLHNFQGGCLTRGEIRPKTFCFHVAEATILILGS